MQPDPQLTSEERAELAALYALGALEGDELARYEQWLGDHPEDAPTELLDLVAEMSLATAAPADPPPALRARVIDSIADLPQDPPPAEPLPRPDPGYTVIREPEGEWRPLPVKGARIKELSDDASTGRTVFILELAPDTNFPTHTHGGVEEVFLLSGDLTSGGIEMQPGDYQRAAAGTKHSSLYSRTGCRALIISDTGDYHPTGIRLFGAAHRLYKRIRSLASVRPPSDN